MTTPASYSSNVRHASMMKIFSSWNRKTNNLRSNSPEVKQLGFWLEQDLKVVEIEMICKKLSHKKGKRFILHFIMYVTWNFKACYPIIIMRKKEWNTAKNMRRLCIKLGGAFESWNKSIKISSSKFSKDRPNFLTIVRKIEKVSTYENFFKISSLLSWLNERLMFLKLPVGCGESQGVFISFKLWRK